jgi:predicted dehydrogenase
MAVRAGKHALVEKPFHYSPTAVSEVLAEAREKKVLVTEAMWTRYLPQSDVVRQILDSEEFGDAEHLQAVFAVDNRAIARLWEPHTGGIVFDMGIYPIAFAHFALGSPSLIHARGSALNNGIDQGADVRLEYESGAVASLLISGISTLPSTAAISGSNQLLTIEHPFFVPSSISLNDKDLYFRGHRWVDSASAQGHDGLFYQADYFAYYAIQGLVESPVHTHAEIISNLAVAETIARMVRD